MRLNLWIALFVGVVLFSCAESPQRAVANHPGDKHASPSPGQMSQSTAPVAAPVTSNSAPAQPASDANAPKVKADKKDKDAPAAAAPTSSNFSQTSSSAWVEYGPNNVAIVRAIVAGSAACPTVQASGSTLNMTVRASPTSNNLFANTVCELALPTSASQPKIQSLTLPTLNPNPQKILILGDTGCIVDTSGKGQYQACDNPQQWPFAQVAAAAAKLNPDLVIHLGDYHYRDSACPGSQSGCAGSPYGDQWSAWNADFFTPAQPLLSAAPWIFVRGNHETCKRAQEGYFRYLDPNPYPASCPEVVNPYSVNFPNLSTLIMDSSKAEITAANWQTIGTVQFQNAWLLTHRPPWLSLAEALAAAGDGDGDDDAPTGAGTTAPAAPAVVGVPANVSFVLAGHRHLFQASSFADGRPVQVVAGNGGTALEGHPQAVVGSQPNQPGTGIDDNSTTLLTVAQWVQHGFILMQANPDQTWTLTIYDQTGAQTMTCLWSTQPSQQVSCNSGS